VSIRLYMDVHVRRAITVSLRLRGVDVMTAQEDQSARLPDPKLLDRATSLDRVLVSFDHDLLREAARRQKQSRPFSGVIYAHQLRVSVGEVVRDLEMLAKYTDPEDHVSRVEYLPLR
jgi:predicted nuclease of predicted toxin-antitoxin system